MDRFRPLLFALALCACLLALLLATAPRAHAAERRIAMEEILPTNTLLFVRTYDASRLGAAVKETALAKMTEQPEFGEFFEALAYKRSELIDRAVADTEVDRELVSDLLSAQYNLALGGVNPLSGEPLLYFGISLPEPPDPETLFAAVKALAWQNLSSNIPVQVLTLRETPVLNLPMPGTDTLFFKENNYIAVLGNLVVFTTDRAGLERMLDNYRAGPRAAVLTRDPTFMAVRRGAGAQPGGSLVYLNTRVAVPVLQALTSPETSNLIDALGLPSVQAAGFSITFHGEGIRHTLYLHSPGERTGILRVLGLDEGAEGAAALIPVEAGSLFAARVDLLQLYREVPRLVDAVRQARTAGAPAPAGTGLASLAGQQQIFGVPAETVLAALGDSILLQKGPSGTAIRFRNADPKAFEQLILKMEANLGATFTTWAERNFVLRYFNQSGYPVPLAPSYVVVGPTDIMIATHPQILKAILRQHTRMPLAKSPEFLRVSEQMPDGLGLLYYVNEPASYTRVYDAALPFLNALTAYDAVAVDPGLLPPGSELTPYLFGFALGAKNTREGLTFTAYSPVGLGGPVLYALDRMIVDNPATMGMAAAAVSGFFGWQDRLDEPAPKTLAP